VFQNQLKMSYLQTELVSHSKKVLSLYKRAVRNVLSYSDCRHVFRYNATLMRARFDQNRNELDMRKAKELLALGEEELFQSLHPQPYKFQNSPGGSAFERVVIPPDWILDYWHPAEKAQYPDYFARREQRKKEYVQMWERKFGKPSPEPHH